MFCKNCGAEINGDAKFCAGCGTPVAAAEQEQNTQQQTYYTEQQPNDAQYETYQAEPVYQAKPVASKNKIVAGLLAIFLGSLGIHKFYLGYTKSGLIMLLVSVIGSILSFGISAAVMEVIGIIEGIMYLTKSDEEFYNIYEANQKEWF